MPRTPETPALKVQPPAQAGNSKAPGMVVMPRGNLPWQIFREPVETDIFGGEGDDLPIIEFSLENNIDASVLSHDENLHDTGFLGYYCPEEKREFYPRPPLKPDLSLEKRDFVIQFLKDANPETLEKFFNLAVEEASVVPADLLKAEHASPSPIPAPRAADAPPLWADRKPGWNKTGMKSSCFLWIKLHYGNKDPERWNPMGLKREHLRHDMPLYRVLAKWIEHHPDDDFDRSAHTKSKPYTDPVEAISRIRDQGRAADRRRREKISTGLG